MQAIKLSAQKRDLVGRKVKKLRKEGMLPATVYGKDVKSENLAVELADFMKVYEKVGETGLVDLSVDGKSLHTLIADVQIHPVERKPLSVEFHAVKLTEKIKAKVPVEFVGESPAVANNVGVLLQTLNEVEVEALPTELPEKMEVDVSKLAEVGQQIVVRELPVAVGVVVLTPAEEVVVKVAPAVAEETKKELEAEEAAKAAAEAEAVAAGVTPSGEAAPVTGEAAKPEEAAKEEKKE